MQSSDAAESVVRMSLNGLEVALRIGGAGAKNIVAWVLANYKDKKSSKGKTNLTKMLKTGKELKIFTVKKDDLRRFQEEAKRYGILFCALVDKKQSKKDSIIDIMVKAEDAAKINRIVQRFKLGAFNNDVKVETEVNTNTKESKDKGIEILSPEDKLLNEILSKPTNKEQNEPINPNVAKTEKSPPSEPLSENKKNKEGTKIENKSDRPSVREKINEIKAEQRRESELVKDTPYQTKDIQNKSPEHKAPKKKKLKERGL